MEAAFKKINNLILNSKKIALSTHERPDGDGLGSSIAFYYYIKDYLFKKKGENKDVEIRIIQPSNYPEQYEIIDPDSIVETYSDEMKNWIKSCDLIILFDIGHFKRARQVSTIGVKNNIDIVCIDHHHNKDSQLFKESIIDLKAPATGLIVWRYLKLMGFNSSWDIKISKALYAALITDTGSFRYNNTTSEAHSMAGELIAFGVKPYNIYVPIYEQRKLSQIRLFSYIMNNLRFNFEGRVCSSIIDFNVFEETDSSLDDCEGFTEFLRSIKDVEISFLITEQFNGEYKINFRSKGKHVINDVADEFGGGGHQFAAGATVRGITPIELEEKILNSLKSKLDKHVN